MYNTKSYSLLLLISICLSFKVQAQQAEKAPYYISLNEADGVQIHEISDFRLSVQYNDSYGRWKEIPLKIYDWKRNLVTTLKLDKAFGLNSFVVELPTVYNDWKLNEIYTCELVNEMGRKHKLSIRLVTPPEKQDPSVNILVNPIEAKCDGVSPSLIEFYGEVSGGKSPYTVNWFVMNRSRTDFLYQPKKEIVSDAGKTSVIRIDKNPEYYVVLLVTDACGGTQQKVVNMVCESRKEKINTLFIEQFDSPLLKKKTGQ